MFKSAAVARKDIRVLIVNFIDTKQNFDTHGW